MQKKKPFVATKKHFYIFIGLFLCLLSLGLCLNNGIVGRYAALPFVYSFGVMAYFLFISVIFLGIFFMIKKRLLPIRFGAYFFATFALILSIFMFVAHFTTVNTIIDGKFIAFAENEKSVNFFSSYSALFDNYWKENSIALYPLSSGIVGYFLVALGNSLFSVNFGGLVFAIIFAVIAFGLYLLPLILRLIGQDKEKKVVKEENKEENETISDYSFQKKNVQKVKNIDVIKDAGDIDPEHYESEITGVPKRSAAISNPTFVQQDSSANNFAIGENSMFAPARFVTDNGQRGQAEEQPFVQPSQPSFEAPQEEVKPVQMQLEFDAKPEVDEKLAGMKTEFTEPKIVPQNHPSQAQPVQQVAPVQPAIPQPVPEKPKPRERVKWIQPSTEVLNTYENPETVQLNIRVAEERMEIINKAFEDFGVGAHVEDYTIGPSITRFNIKYNHNVSYRSVANMIGDIQIRLNGESTRFESSVTGQATSGLEVPNAQTSTVAFKDVYEALPDVKKHPLSVAFGKNIKGDVIYADFDEFPHILIAGTTGSGKSIFVNSIIVTLIMRNSPDDLKLVLVDPKKVEMSRYKDMPHLLCPIITEAKEAKVLMDRLCKEMEDRYALFAANNCTNIKEFNEDAPGLGLEKIPYIIAILDEYADIVDQCKEISMPVVSIAQKARACGIHLLISTQRPSTNVVTGTIKGNLPTHVALMTASSVDSVTIIGEGGAEKLIGRGDMLVQSPLVSRVGVTRLQGCFIHRTEITRVVGYLKEHYETHFDEKFLNLEQEADQAASEYAQTPEFKEAAGNTEEDRYQAIKEWVMAQEFMSISRIQRECAVGFNRAGRFFLRLQAEGVVGDETEGNKGCRVLMRDSTDMSSDPVTSDEQTSFRSDD